MPKWILLISLLTTVYITAAQQVWEGKITDGQISLESVSVVLKDSAGKIIAFTRSNNDGVFTFTIPVAHPGFKLEFSSIGYKKKTMALPSQFQKLDITLEEDAVRLKDVILTDRPSIKTSGDTSTYNPADFADKQDRSIGDVLKKMPGISVDDAGKIEYNGKSISSLYIDGDNVLDNQYNIGTQAIPHTAVDRVQVIEKDQPIKMLRKNNRSENVALNLVLKKEARIKLMGDATIGAGVPEKYNAEINTMLFRKQLKFLNALKTNNIGQNLQTELTRHDFFGMSSSQNHKPDAFLSAGSSTVPGLPLRRTLFNNAALANLNNLFKLNDDYQVKINAAIYFDFQRMDYSKSTVIYLPDKTIRYKETQTNQYRPQMIQTKIDFTGNAEKYYLKNSLSIHSAQGRTNSKLNTNDQAANQNLKNETTEFLNELSFSKTLSSKNNIAFASTLSKTSLSENLYLNPGINPDIFNHGSPYAGLAQHVKLPTFFSHEQLSFTHGNKNLFQTYAIGHVYQKQLLTSELMKQDGNIQEPAGIDFRNNLSWNFTKWFFSSMYEYKSQKADASLKLPLSRNTYRYDDEKLNKYVNNAFIVFNPQFFLKYQTGIEHNLTLNYAHSLSAGNIENIYYGSILRNYRSLIANDAPLSQQTSDMASLTFNFKKAIQMIFFNLGTSFGNVSSNTISSYIITDEQEKRIAIPLFNQSKSWSAFGSASKYFFDLSSTGSVKASFSSNNMDQLQNEVLLKFKGYNISLSSGFKTKFSKKFNTDYDIRYNISRYRSAGEKIGTSFSQVQQQLMLYLSSLAGMDFNATVQHLFSHQPGQKPVNYVFADAGVRYNWKKMKADVLLDIRNIGNIRTFETITQSSNSYITGIYQIPGRMVVVSVRFLIR